MIAQRHDADGALPPHFEDAEKSLPASWMFDPSTIDGSRVRLSEFYSDRHREVARAALQVYDEGGKPDAVTVAERLERNGKLEEVGGTPYLLEMLSTVPHAAHAAYYAGIIRRKAALRSLADGGTEIATAARQPDADPVEIGEQCRRLFERSLAHRPKRFRTVREVLGTFDVFGPPAKRFIVGDGGFRSIDFGPGMVVIVAAAPSTGKTALGLQWTFDALRIDPDLRAVILNAEMTAERLIERQLARFTGVDFDLIRNRMLDDYHRDRIAFGLAELDDVADRIAFVSPPFTTDNLDAAIARHKPDIVVVDYVQIVDPPGDFNDPRTRTDAVIKACRRWANDGMGVLAVSAVSRQKGSSGSTYAGLNMASLRESGGLEFAADAIYLLGKTDEPGVLHLHNPKRRDGRLCDFNVVFDGAHQSFNAVDTSDADEFLHVFERDAV